MAEWSNAAVLKTVEGHTSGGSNPSFSAKARFYPGFFFIENVDKKCKGQKGKDMQIKG